MERKSRYLRDSFTTGWRLDTSRGATRDQVVALAQDYSRHPQFYAPDIQGAHVLARENQHFSAYYRFYRHAVVTTVYNIEFSVDYHLPDRSLGYSLARAVRIAEVQNSGKLDEKELPVGNDHGLNLYAVPGKGQRRLCTN